MLIEVLERPPKDLFPLEFRLSRPASQLQAPPTPQHPRWPLRPYSAMLRLWGLGRSFVWLSLEATQGNGPWRRVLAEPRLILV